MKSIASSLNRCAGAITAMVITGAGIITAIGVGDTTAGITGIGDGVAITGTTGTGIIVIGGDGLSVVSPTPSCAGLRKASLPAINAKRLRKGSGSDDPPSLTSRAMARLESAGASLPLLRSLRAKRSNPELHNWIASSLTLLAMTKKNRRWKQSSFFFGVTQTRVPLSRRIKKPRQRRGFA